MSFLQKAEGRVQEMADPGCNGEQKEEHLMDQMSGYMVINRNPVHKNHSITPGPVNDVSFRSESPQYRKEKASKKIINLTPPLTPSSCSIWGRRKNHLSWVRFRTISFPDFDKHAFTFTSHVRTGQARNRNTCMYKCSNW